MVEGERGEVVEAREVRAPTHAEHARTLAARAEVATLSTHSTEPAGYPHGSLVLVSFAGPMPILLLSDLAEHTRNLVADDRCSLMLAEASAEEAMAGQRVTLLGRARSFAEQGSDAAKRAREVFLERHPSASDYCDFSDFNFYGLEMETVRYIGGFGRMSWLTESEWKESEPDPIAPHADGIITHMNDDHAGNLVDYCRAFGGISDTQSATMTRVDRYGFEMAVRTTDGEEELRLGFSNEVKDVMAVRRALVYLAKKSRERLA
ncbi:DUF2470 domain-containing protein [Myxococcota bacterium]|nr:DUF2470 domain-containing protein [Myxococcota bacterium]